MPDETQSWFNSQLDWGKLFTILAALGGLAWFLMTTWADNKAQLVETRAAISQLSSKLDENMSRNTERLASAERDLRMMVQTAKDASARDLQAVKDRIVQVEAKQEADDKRAREEAITMATLREQMSNVVITLNNLREVIVSQSAVTRPTPILPPITPPIILNNRK